MSTNTVEPKKQATIASRKLPPGPRGHIVWGNAREQARDRLAFQMNLHRQYGDVVRWRIAHITLYQVTHPDHIKHVLQDNHRNYTKGRLFQGMLRPLLGNGLLTSENDFWLRQRRLMQPMFHRKRIAAFGALMTEATLTMLDRWEAQAGRDQPVDVAEELMALTLEIVTKALFGTDTRKHASTIYEAFGEASEHLIHRFDAPLYPPAFVPTPRNRRFVAARNAINRVVYDVIAERRATNEDTGDLLSLLLQVHDEETGEGMTEIQLRDEVLTLMLAGHETTTNALAWTWYLLVQHPEVDRKFRAELHTVLGTRVPTVDDLPNLPYTKMVLEESMRVYPPIWAHHRQAINDDEIGGFHVPANTIIDLVTYVTHHRSDLWDNPQRFDPERFSPQQAAARPRLAYNPFTAGPRQCIGMGFAMVEAQLVLATIAQRYRLALVPGHPVEPHPQVTLRPRYGMPMTLQPA